MSEQAKQLDEEILPDDYPVRWGFLYVADGEVVRNTGATLTAERFKERSKIKELRRCDIKGRDLWHMMT